MKIVFDNWNKRLRMGLAYDILWKDHGVQKKPGVQKKTWVQMGPFTLLVYPGFALTENARRSHFGATSYDFNSSELVPMVLTYRNST